MKPMILSYGRFIRGQFRVRALIGLLALTALIGIKELLDIVWDHFHINRLIADIMVQTACAPVATLLIAPMFSSFAPLFHRLSSVRVRQSAYSDPFEEGLYDDSWNPSGHADLDADWYTDPSNSWFSGNIFHDDSH
ncbi:hypothetical protein [Paraburkholderia tropica]|uniref:hypothetical protein n=1 Tax=Paraburkholderia tropica TaxID=92647 RepID=UPI002ABD8715|nr:hypothetical protein [Paraburkholderia tropica]